MLFHYETFPFNELKFVVRNLCITVNGEAVKELSVSMALLLSRN